MAKNSRSHASSKLSSNAGAEGGKVTIDYLLPVYSTAQQQHFLLPELQFEFRVKQHLAVVQTSERKESADFCESSTPSLTPAGKSLVENMPWRDGDVSEKQSGDFHHADGVGQDGRRSRLDKRASQSCDSSAAKKPTVGAGLQETSAGQHRILSGPRDAPPDDPAPRPHLGGGKMKKTTNRRRRVGPVSCAVPSRAGRKKKKSQPEAEKLTMPPPPPPSSFPCMPRISSPDSPSSVFEEGELNDGRLANLDLNNNDNAVQGFPRDSIADDEMYEPRG